MNTYAWMILTVVLLVAATAVAAWTDIHTHRTTNNLRRTPLPDPRCRRR